MTEVWFVQRLAVADAARPAVGIYQSVELVHVG